MKLNFDKHRKNIETRTITYNTNFKIKNLFSVPQSRLLPTFSNFNWPSNKVQLPNPMYEVHAACTISAVWRNLPSSRSTNFGKGLSDMMEHSKPTRLAKVKRFKIPRILRCIPWSWGAGNDTSEDRMATWLRSSWTTPDAPGRSHSFATCWWNETRHWKL